MYIKDKLSLLINEMIERNINLGEYFFTASNYF